MGRAANRKWAFRIFLFSTVSITKKLEMLSKFGHHPKFKVR